MYLLINLQLVPKHSSSSFGVKVSTLNNPLESDEVPDCDKSIVDWCQEGSLMMVKKLFDENNLYTDEEVSRVKLNLSYFCCYLPPRRYVIRTPHLNRS